MTPKQVTTYLLWVELFYERTMRKHTSYQQQYVPDCAKALGQQATLLFLSSSRNNSKSFNSGLPLKYYKEAQNGDLKTGTVSKLI